MKEEIRRIKWNWPRSAHRRYSVVHCGRWGGGTRSGPVDRSVDHRTLGLPTCDLHARL